MRHPARTLAAAAVAAALLGAGCGRPARLDVDRAEASVRQQLAATWGVPVAAVACPSRIDVEEGARTTCRATVAGTTVAVEVRQTDGDGALAVTPARAVLEGDRVAADIEAVLADRFDRPGATVTCPGPAVRVAAPGATFTCAAADGDERRDVLVRVRDARGALTYRLDP